MHVNDERCDPKLKPVVMVIGDAGGPHVRTRAGALAAEGHHMHLLTPRASETSGVCETISAGWDCTNFISAFPQLESDIVHIHYASSIGAWAFAASNDSRPLVVSVMGGDVLFDEQSQPSAIARWLVKQVLVRANKVTVKSEYLKRALLHLGVKVDKIETVMWGVETNYLRSEPTNKVRQLLGIPGSAKVIFSPRMLHSFYRIEIIIRALAELDTDTMDAHLIIAEYEADQGYKTECIELAEALGIAMRVHFVGCVSSSQMPAYYMSADVVVSIPPSDGFPQTVMEAMACGTPNILTMLPCFEGLLEDGENALFVDPNAGALAAGIQLVFHDVALEARLLKGGHKFIAQFGNFSKNVVTVSRIYQELGRQGTARPLSIFVRLVIRGILIGKNIRDQFRSMLKTRANKDEKRSI